MLLVSCPLLFFFFFKQKTAYEMRMSDWSSDVCSSDLRIPHLHCQHAHRRLQQRDGDPLAWAAVSGVMVAAALRYQIVGARSAFVEAFRATCLRVLPYARIMIGAVQVEQEPQIGRAHVRTPVTNAHIV